MTNAETLSAAELKAKFEAIWNNPGVRQGANVTVWTLYGSEINAHAGEARNPKLDASTLANIRKREAHYGPPPPAPYSPRGPLPMDKETRQRYRERFPRNWRYLVANYGITEAKPKKERELAGIIDAVICHEDKPAKAIKTTAKPSRRITKRKIEAVASILAKLDRAKWPEFLAKWIDRGEAENIAANDNIDAAARSVLRLAYASAL